jgi:hypothetical protein
MQPQSHREDLQYNTHPPPTTQIVLVMLGCLNRAVKSLSLAVLRGQFPATTRMMSHREDTSVTTADRTAIVTAVQSLWQLEHLPAVPLWQVLQQSRLKRGSVRNEVRLKSANVRGVENTTSEMGEIVMMTASDATTDEAADCLKSAAKRCPRLHRLRLSLFLLPSPRMPWLRHQNGPCRVTAPIRTRRTLHQSLHARHLRLKEVTWSDLATMPNVNQSVTTQQKQLSIRTRSIVVALQRQKKRLSEAAALPLTDKTATPMVDDLDDAAATVRTVTHHDRGRAAETSDLVHHRRPKQHLVTTTVTWLKSQSLWTSSTLTRLARACRSLYPAKTSLPHLKASSANLRKSFQKTLSLFARALLLIRTS